VRLRHWEWSRITDVTVDPDPDPRPLLGVLVAGWVPSLTLSNGERVPLDILAKRSERSALKVVCALRARLDEASVRLPSQAATTGRAGRSPAPPPSTRCPLDGGPFHEQRSWGD
jgi:hypothetical protein